jgi:hypothetical protein
MQAKRAEIVKFLSVKTEFKSKTIKKKQRTLNNDEKVNISRR